MDAKRALSPVTDYKWELYNIADDYSESNDLAAKMPSGSICRRSWISRPLARSRAMTSWACGSQNSIYRIARPQASIFRRTIVAPVRWTARQRPREP
jgi:hypothetical protein